MSEIVKLLNLAWQNCVRDIHDVISIYLGVLIAGMTFLTYTFLNLQGNFQPLVNYVDPSGAYTISTAFSMSMYFSIFNAFSILTFLAIIAILVEYAMSFTYVCYYYDNCSWVVPNTIIKTAKTITNWYWDRVYKNKKISRESSKKSRDDLQSRIAKIRKPDEL